MVSITETSFIQEMFAERIGGNTFGKGTELYKFEKIKRARSAAMLANPGVELIDMGLGEPDAMADPGVVQVLCEEAQKVENRFYSDNGIESFQAAAANYMMSMFQTGPINPSTEINHCIGSKSALAQLPAAFINPGDVLLTTTPGYPVMATHTAWLGGEVVKLPLVKENGFLPDLQSVPADVLERAKLLYINYPNNPTGATATYAFYEEVVAFCKKHHIIVISDEAYAGLMFDGEQPLSILSVPGAKDVAVSVQSLSKAFNMTGWRLGFIAGNELVVKALASVKDNCDSGQFIAIQKAGVYCLEHPEITLRTAEKYSRRHELLTTVLQSAGFDVVKPKGSFYLYVACPKGVKGGTAFASAEDFSQYLIHEKLISTVPWDEAGSYIRFSVTFEARDEDDERRIMNEISNRLSEMKLYW
ncbi:LL-diaminopimelate aminotransferase [Paenibacillus phyllosphaerae]|uniref:Aminotransferase n=1 Tax=Paenibacillus phyllosphaerae TaxID=274593 RepID=A0A7W5B435_9BACL|nr:LL-diaminopimelate aminotransferase [Paenibacillus phyllosphaerae]MBB3114048.1 LL-diaminopimelate aminotransferase [Paenibacillus phyllosphaerae]